MTSELIQLTCGELAARLLPKGTAGDRAILTTALERIARSQTERRGRAPAITTATLVAELQAMNLGDGERVFVLRGLANVHLNCTWSLETFDAAAPGFRLLLLFF